MQVRKKELMKSSVLFSNKRNEEALRITGELLSYEKMTDVC